jgi:radical SAM protein with 4Fe4S-binding SPASM domain
MFINPYGDVHPCLHMDRYVTGNVRQGGLAAVWQNERHRKVIARLPPDMYPVCSGCCLFRANLTLSQQLRLWLFGTL